MNTTNTSYSSTSLTATSSMRRQGTVMNGQVTLPSTSSSSALSLLRHIDSLSTEPPSPVLSTFYPLQFEFLLLLQFLYFLQVP